VQPPPLPFSMPDRSAPRDWLVDLSGVEYPTAACLGHLVALNSWLRASGGRLVVDKVGERAFEVFAVARLTVVLDVRRPAGP
jgi:anti-anti-sigma regulatory factor